MPAVLFYVSAFQICWSVNKVAVCQTFPRASQDIIACGNEHSVHQVIGHMLSTLAEL